MNWINVEDKLPKKYETVIVFFKGKLKRVTGHICDGWFNGEYWDCYALLPGLNETLKVTHWMPLPEPPK